MEQYFLELVRLLGEDPTREGLRDTPRRAAETFKYLTEGYKQCEEQLMQHAIFPCHESDMVIVRGIEFYSLCEHHLLPFFGNCHIAYLPNKKIIGLSAFPRIVNLYARRLQTQERLTYEITQCLERLTQAQGLGVVIEAKHLCLAMRSMQPAVLKTSAQRGIFSTDPHVRADFRHLIQG